MELYNIESLKQSRAQSRSIARDALGLGLRPIHYPYILEHSPKLDYFEIISENFMGSALVPQQNLERILQNYPIVLHGVGLNLLGHEDLDEDYLNRLCRLADQVDAAFISDHLCWTGSHGLRHHDLLPSPYTKDLIDYASARAHYVQKRLGRPFALENLSSYVSFKQSEMSEWEFYNAIVKKADIWYMLDINNIFVSSQNLNFDPLHYVHSIDYDRVAQVHLAGHQKQADGSIIDTHDQAVAEAVWQLYKRAWQLGGPFPTLLEWDDQIPPMKDVLIELNKTLEWRS
ncbi:MAG: DUF692 domain-containing protein [Proteobacteria bacterium]|nr:DUF692 domain-containing protein [Pseudomonadota bacterium]